MQLLLLSRQSPLAQCATELPVQLRLLDGSEKSFDVATQGKDRALVGTSVPLFYLKSLLRRCQRGLLAEVRLIVDAPMDRATKIGFRCRPWLRGIHTVAGGPTVEFPVSPAPILPSPSLGAIVDIPIAKSVFSESPSSFPCQLQIQTTNGCRSMCPYCPKTYIDSPIATMQLHIFRQITAACKRGQPDTIELYFHGEPLLDERMPQLATEAKSASPQSIVSIVTHENMLDKMSGGPLLDSGLDVAFVSVNVVGKPNEESLRRRLEPIAAVREMFLAHQKELVVVTLHNFLQQRVRGPFRRICLELELPLEAFAATSRARSIDIQPFLRQGDEAPKGPCTLPFVKAFFRLDGAMVLCCEDWKYCRVLGYIDEAPIEEIWTGEAYRGIRRELLQRRLQKPCIRCDLAPVTSL